MSMKERWSAPTPKFWKRVQKIAITVGAVAGVIIAAPITLPAAVVTVATYAISNYLIESSHYLPIRTYQLICGCCLLGQMRMVTTYLMTKYIFSRAQPSNMLHLAPQTRAIKVLL